MHTKPERSSPGEGNGQPCENPPPLPPPGFDPVHNESDAAQLEDYWLPSRPDPRREPGLYAHWKEMFCPVPNFVEPDSCPFQHRRHPFAVGTVGPGFEPRPIARHSRFETSRNWSGAYIVPSRGGRFKRIVGRWTVPDVQTGTGSNPGNLPYCQCSIWVGLDGKKRWTPSMPQIGTAHSIDAPGYSAALPVSANALWWQWWSRHGYSAAWEIRGVPICPGDVVLCSLTLVSPLVARFHVVNRTSGRFATQAVCSKKPADGSSAEWIVEKPAAFPQDPDWRAADPLRPMPDYGELLLESCIAEHDTNHTMSLRNPRLIRMVETVENPNRAQIISAPRALNEPPGTLQMAYHEP
jgi:hypothetical protein